MLQIYITPSSTVLILWISQATEEWTARQTDNLIPWRVCAALETPTRILIVAQKQIP